MPDESRAMAEPLTAARIKEAVRQLRARQAERTKPCESCGGEPWGPDETTRLCPVCRHYVILRDAVGEDSSALRRLISDALEHGPTTEYPR